MLIIKSMAETTKPSRNLQNTTLQTHIWDKISNITCKYFWQGYNKGITEGKRHVMPVYSKKF